MNQVFISYPRDKAKGQAAAKMLYATLAKEQITAFLDEVSIEPGDRWLKALKDGIANCQIMLAIISSASDDRKWFEKEYNEAQKHDVLVIPVLVDDVDIPMQLTDLQAIQLFGEQAAEQQTRLLQKVSKHLGIDKINPLIEQAKHAKRTEAYDKAMELWKEVLAHAPENTSANREIEKLQRLSDTKARGTELLQQLALRLAEIQPAFPQIAALLNQASPRQGKTVFDLTEQFLNHSLSAEDYMYACQGLVQAQAASGSHPVDYAALAERITRGEIVLFLGSEIAKDYGDSVMTEHQVAGKLAAQTNYGRFNGGLSSIAEYMRLKPDYGPSGLWNKLQTAIQEDETEEASLYQLLARAKAPLILIASAYDNTLGNSFKAVNKPFVELSSIMSRGDDYDIGHVIVSYSDNHAADCAYTEEELSGLKLYESGYSIIYKIRGSCCPSSDNELKRDALTVSESDYFTFARYAEKIIPSYLAKQFRGRGFLFLGFSPASWEQRLLVNALLAKRKNANEGCFTVGTSQDPLEAAYWQKQKVQHYDVDLSQLDEHIEEALL